MQLIKVNVQNCSLLAIVNGSITYQKQQITEKRDITQHTIDEVSMYCSVISPFPHICYF